VQRLKSKHLQQILDPQTNPSGGAIFRLINQQQRNQKESLGFKKEVAIDTPATTDYTRARIHAFF